MLTMQEQAKCTSSWTSVNITRTTPPNIDLSFGLHYWSATMLRSEIAMMWGKDNRMILPPFATSQAVKNDSRPRMQVASALGSSAM